MNQPRKKKNQFKRLDIRINAEFYFIIHIIANMKRITNSQVVDEAFFHTFQPHYIFICAWQYQDVNQKVISIETCINHLNRFIIRTRTLMNKYENAKLDSSYKEMDAYNQSIRSLNKCQKHLKIASNNFDHFFHHFSHKFYLSNSLGSRVFSSRTKKRIVKIVKQSKLLQKYSTKQPEHHLSIRMPTKLYDLIRYLKKKYHAQFKFIVESAIVSINRLPYLIVPIEDAINIHVQEQLTDVEKARQGDFKFFYEYLIKVMQISNQISSKSFNYLDGMINFFNSHKKSIIKQDGTIYFQNTYLHSKKFLKEIITLEHILLILKKDVLYLR